MSDLYRLSSGVPRLQGSILDPLLFLIFITDFPNASAYFSVKLFADDTSLTASGNDLDNLRAILQESEAKLEMKNFKPPSIFVWR